MRRPPKSGGKTAPKHPSISQHPFAEAALQTKEMLRVALSAARLGLYDLNLETGEAHCSPEYAAMLGYSPDDFRLDLTKWAAMVHPDDFPAFSATLEDCKSGRIPGYSIEYRLRARDGTWRWFLSTGKVSGRSRNGRPLRMIGTHADVTERKKAEEALRSSNAFLDAIFPAPIQPGWRIARARSSGSTRPCATPSTSPTRTSSGSTTSSRTPKSRNRD